MTGPPVPRSRIAFIGVGHVGATAAYATMLRALFEEIVLIDGDGALAEAEAADLSDANALTRPAHIWAGTFADAATAQVAVITAGTASHGDETRLSLAARSAVIVRDCTRSLAQVGFEGILLIAANPVDLMTVVAIREAGLPPGHVIGTGTLLDSSRMRRALSRRLNVAAQAVEGFVFGEHGDSAVVAYSGVGIAGESLDDFVALGPRIDLDQIADEVRTAGYRIIGGKGYTSFGIATAIVRICEAVVRDERAVLPVSAWLTGEFGIRDLCLSAPCIVGAKGVERILQPRLSEEERSALQESARVLREALSSLDTA